MTEAIPLATIAPAPIPAGTARLYPLADLLDAWAADAEAARLALETHTARGPITGLPKVDRELGGHLSPGLHALHGEAGTGKSALALQIAASCGAPALFVTTEMSPLELMRRHTARVTDTYLGRLKSGELSPAASCQLAELAAGEAPMLAILDATRAYIPARQAGEKSPAGILEAARELRDHHVAEHLLIVVDSLHSWAAGAPASFGADSEYERLNAAITELQHLAAELSAAVLVVVERAKADTGSTAQTAGAGTRRIAYGAETVLALQREKGEAGGWEPDAGGEYHVHLKLAKNRNGATGKKVALRFCGALQSFREV